MFELGTQARQLYGIAPNDIGRPFRDLELSYQPAELRSLIDRIYAERKGVTLADAEHRLKDGNPRRLDIHLMPLNENGAVVGESPPTDIDLGAPVLVTGAWDKPVDGVVRLTLDVLTSTGVSSGGETAEYRPFKLGSAPFPPDPAQLSSNPAVH